MIPHGAPQSYGGVWGPHSNPMWSPRGEPLCPIRDLTGTMFELSSRWQRKTFAFGSPTETVDPAPRAALIREQFGGISR